MPNIIYVALLFAFAVFHFGNVVEALNLTYLDGVCPQNEVMMNCSFPRICEPSCARPQINNDSSLCVQICPQAQCQCAIGYVRGPSGDCINYNSCVEYAEGPVDKCGGCTVINQRCVKVPKSDTSSTMPTTKGYGGGGGRGIGRGVFGGVLKKIGTHMGAIFKKKHAPKAHRHSSSSSDEDEEDCGDEEEEQFEYRCVDYLPCGPYQCALGEHCQLSSASTAANPVPQCVPIPAESSTSSASTASSPPPPSSTVAA